MEFLIKLGALAIACRLLVEAAAVSAARAL